MRCAATHLNRVARIPRSREVFRRHYSRRHTSQRPLLGPLCPASPPCLCLLSPSMAHHQPMYLPGSPGLAVVLGECITGMRQSSVLQLQLPRLPPLYALRLCALPAPQLRNGRWRERFSSLAALGQPAGMPRARPRLAAGRLGLGSGRTVLAVACHRSTLTSPSPLRTSACETPLRR